MSLCAFILFVLTVMRCRKVDGEVQHCRNELRVQHKYKAFALVDSSSSLPNPARCHVTHSQTQHPPPPYSLHPFFSHPSCLAHLCLSLLPVSCITYVTHFLLFLFSSVCAVSFLLEISPCLSNLPLLLVYLGCRLN